MHVLKLYSGAALLLLFLGCNTTNEQEVVEEMPITDSEETQEDNGALYGETIYVPIYSSIFYHTAKRTLELAATLSVHNTDLDDPIRLTKVDYYNLKGERIRKYLKQPVVLRPLQTINYVIEERDKSGGTGANFIVEWRGAHGVNSPIVEAIMIGAGSGQGISFTSIGKVIERHGEDAP